ncbi:oligosaccharide flippase family protein [Pseudomonas costantinii]|uniref:Membrane protein involved in the export of O-antigen and teichoic acid n=1 Tax=Pseudomonas costantinii TaxID=168469 RepID=A0A1S2V468_9PSED|nr:oligosaccharide flippase family protein [Pseudomonas costantinii]OIN53514.1 polysaccharide biosynthesis protein [Pseudomonas costantinii]SEE36139.1 Membrane protein involved in the export of O-antigen and teichoic acid [Pseudomonas costantinii]
MSSLFKNISANFIGQGWIALMGICFVPLYLKFIGVEGYGLVGFFVVLSSAMAMFDGGFGAVATREASVYENASEADKPKIILLLKSIEWVFWSVAIVVGFTVVLLAPLISNHWLAVHPEKIDSVTQSLRIMGVALLMQFPIAFYYGSLIGLQKQVTLNIVSSTFATIRSLGAVLVLWLISPTVEWFFIWQCVISLATVLTLRLKLIEGMPGWREAKRFSTDALRRLGGFAAGVGITNVLAFLLMQIDKIILSKVLPLKDFGYYMLAWTVGTIAFRLISPVFNAYYPKIVSLVAAQRTAETFQMHVRSSQVLSMLVIPVSVWIALYSEKLLLLWTRDESIAVAASTPLMVLALGTMTHSFMHMPYALQLAHGWTRFSVWQNATAAIFMVPLTYYLATHYGLSGGAWPWLILNLGYVALCSPIIFFKLKIKPARTWYAEAIFIPATIATCSLLAMNVLFELLNFSNIFTMMFSLGATYIFVALRLFVFRFDLRRLQWRNTL